jgi:acyl carrier protein
MSRRYLPVNDHDDRLMRCFMSAFPGATRDEIRTAKFDSIAGWDSLRGVALLAVLDEEFGIQIDLSELLELETFDSMKRYLLERGVISPGNK